MSRGAGVTRLIIGISMMIWAYGCASSDAPESVASGPRIIEADRTSVVLGETIYFTGLDLLSPEDGLTRLNFVGSFVGQSGTRTQVDVTVTPLYEGKEDGLHILRRSRIGPFTHPFAPGADAEPGEF